MVDVGPAPVEDASLAIVLSGGGARAAYQVGLLRCLGRRMPELRFPIITGVSAGAINAAYLAAHGGDLREAAEGLTSLWCGLQPSDIFHTHTSSLMRIGLAWTLRLFSGGLLSMRSVPSARGLVDTAPLRRLLARELGAADNAVPGIEENLARGRLRGVAVNTLDYSTGETITWVQGCEIRDWERPHRRSARGRITVDHVAASAALPLLFPAVELEGDWHGDGGVRLSTPLSPALHLGASRILAVSTRYERAAGAREPRASRGYPPPALIAGHLLNAIFLDLFDEDVRRVEIVNRALGCRTPRPSEAVRHIDILTLRPSQDLGRLAARYEARLPALFRFLTRGLGTRDTSSADLLSLLMFQSDYLARLIEIGESDAELRMPEITKLIDTPRAASGDVSVCG